MEEKELIGNIIKSVTNVDDWSLTPLRNTGMQ